MSIRTTPQEKLDKVSCLKNLRKRALKKNISIKITEKDTPKRYLDKDTLTRIR